VQFVLVRLLVDVQRDEVGVSRDGVAGVATEKLARKDSAAAATTARGE
jgi:hypothetical protein